MRIAKYLVLLMGLFTVALLVFVFTQEGNFKLNKSIIVKNIDPKIVYNYVGNLNNWHEFIGNSKEKKAILKNEFVYYDQKFKIKKKYPLDSILLSNYKDDNEVQLKISFSKINQSTKITWNIKGNYTYKEKFLALFYGNNNKNQIQKINNYLVKINNNLYQEYFYYDIKYDKIITLPAQSFVYKTVNCSFSNHEKEIKNQLIILRKTLDSLKLKSNNNPFLIDQKLNFENQNSEFKVCLEIPKYSDTLFSKKEVGFNNLISYQQVFYHGNKKYLNNFWNNINQELDKRNLIYLKNHSIIEIIDKKNRNTIKKHEFKTKFLIPIYKNELQKTIIKTSVPKLYKPKKQIRETIKPIEKPEIKEVEQKSETKNQEN
jgi:hypothetical protein